MTMIKWFLLATLAAAMAVPFTRPVIAGEIADVLDTPALRSELAVNSLMTGVTRAGDRLVAVGQRGHILYSDDTGQHWQQAEVPVSSDLVAVYFSTPERGWAVGHDGVVLHSSDRGQTWNRQLDGRQVGPIMLAYYQHQLDSHPDDAVLRTRVAEAQRMVDEGADKPFLDVWFENERVGYIVGAFNLIFRTDDGGLRWTPLLDLTENPGALNLYALRSVGGELFIVGEQGLVMKLDRVSGRFEALPTPYNGSFFGVTGTPGAALVFGLRGNVFRSTDGGESWNKVNLGLPLSITASSVTVDGRIVLVSQAGHVLVSADDGASFQLQPNTTPAPVAAAQVASDGSLVLAGTRGLRQLPLD
ncbi:MULTISPECIES: YCF48-related protein [unclassified Pseudomonas]|uniref:WD40/YVTN/BNR-like repeat-containing protein n=1 Tax=unclassified Pseudomonas TaxID=196821 RepID=UPI000C877CCE|nr:MULTISPECIES: YCF48-related protein [unclassified Pseudomonas]PNB72263.1 glycosyl hydrolase [Pseudomonas sp. GW456-E7]PMU08648.1 glycosyl hydrolase [Pseudomonas sp. FW305-20]PMU19426.1 glycosyl hydrolase [Pseudomonas sp. FW305-122]PMU38541.1 glycosyl hydrolase [Pseudomonas sp. FW305-47B]PMX59414.1 glycosyl hydrolase [Pseudomonas sp. FW305-33]